MLKVPSLILCFGFPVIVLVLGFSLAGWFGFTKIPPLIEEVGRGDAQKGFVVELEKPGRYMVWSVLKEDASAKAIRDERLALPPGARIYVYDEKTGREKDLSKLIQQKKSYGGENSVSVGSFETNLPNEKIRVKATGVRSSLTVSVTPDNTAKAVQVFLVLLGIVLLSIAVAIFVFIFLIHRRQRALSAGK